MRKIYPLVFILLVTVSFTASAQDYWTASVDKAGIVTDKAVARLSFPKEFKAFALNAAPLRQQLMSVVDQPGRATVISLPNAEGTLEQFQVFEASNFDPRLQARFPEIRAFSGRGLTDKYATLKLSISPQGIQTMTFRTGKPNEFIEPYSEDHTVYAVFRSERAKGALPWICSTPEQELVNNINAQIGRTESNAGQLKTMRLAQSCNGEYSNWFGAFNATQVGLVLAAFNNTLTRCNGCYEKDLAIHLNLIPETVNVIFYDPLTDPYTTLSAWNNQLQTTLTSLIGEANYDIGHMFGQSGGGGNAGCIGCVCVDNQKGRGITSPADGIPQGDNFDIDYVAHEVGHQMGGNHTFSHNLEGTGQNKEVGSGITIMGYAGITSRDVAPHSIDIFHETTIQQIQNNMAGKTCPITISLAGSNATPVVAPVSSYTIPMMTPFALTGTATDADGDPLTYCWEQDDNAPTGFSGANSIAYATKTSGPNWLTWPATTTGTRICPILTTILAGNQITPPLPGGDPGTNIEALSSVARTLNFRLTVRDNAPYVPGSKIGQTGFTDMAVTVTTASGPFQITTANTATSWIGGSTQNLTWDVANSTLAPVSTANVKISWSTDGGLTFPTVLAASTPNDGSENIVVPATTTSTGRIKVEAIGNIFFDINNAHVTVTPPPNSFDFMSPAPAVSACPAGASMSITLGTIQNGAFTTPINLTASGNPAGTTVTFTPNPVNPGSSTTVTLNGTNTLNAGSYTITVAGTAGAVIRTRDLVFTITAGAGPSITSQPANQSICINGNTSFSVTAATATSFQWQVSTDGGANWSNVSNGGVYSGATSNTLNITGATGAMNNYRYRVIAGVQCGSTTSTVATLTVNVAPAITTHPSDVILCAGGNNTFSVAATGSNLTYQWQSSPTGCAGTFTNIAGATTSSYTVSGVTSGMTGTAYRVVVSGSCTPAVTSNCAVLTVITSVSITTQPVSTSVCVGSSTSFTAVGNGTGVIYQWQVSTDGGANWTNVTNTGVYSGANTGTLNITGANVSMNNYQYRVQVSNSTCTTPGISNAATLTVNTLPLITSHPVSATLCSGATATFNAGATGTGVGYQWQVSTDGGNTWTNLSNAAPYSGVTTSSLTVTGVTTALNNLRYRAVASGTCPPAVNTNAATLNVINPVSVTTQPAASVLCSGNNTSFTVAGSSTETISYQWQVSTDGGNSWTNVTNGGAYSGATTPTLNVTGATASMNNNRYRAQMSTATCSSPVASGNAQLTVRQTPTISLTSGPLTSLLPGQTSLLTATPSAATGGVQTITWSFNGAAPSPAIPGNTYNVNVEHIGDYQVSVSEAFSNPALTCSSQSAVVKIDATASPRLFVFPTPNDGRFTVSYYNNGGAATKRKIAIFDSKGSMVYNREFNISGLYTLIPIDIQSVNTGIYYIVVGSASGQKLAEAKVHVK